MTSPECDAYIIQILQIISVSRILPPLLVVNILSKNKDLPISVLQEYISDQLVESIEAVSESSREMLRLKLDTEHIRKCIKEQKTKGRVFQTTSAT